MPRPKNFHTHKRRNAQLLTQLPRQSLHRRLPSPQFSARKFPHQFETVPAPPLTNQNLPLRLNQPSHHSQHADSRITTTRPFRTAGTSRQAGFRNAVVTFARAPVAAQANTINSGAARATSESDKRAPASTIIFPPAVSTNSATQGGELIRGLGQASQ